MVAEDNSQEACVAEHVETLHGRDGTSVLVFRVIRETTPGRVTWDVVEPTSKKGAQELKSLRKARQYAKKLLRGAA